MNVALCNEVVRDLDLARQAAFAASLGYDGLELAPFTLDPDAPHRLDAARVRAARRAIEGEGLVVSGLHWLLVAPKGLSVTDPAPDVAARTAEAVRSMIELCAELGGRYLIHGSPAQRSLTDGQEEVGRARALEHFALAADAAAAAGVEYLLEPLSRDQTGFVNTLDEASAIVDRVASPAFAAMLDCCSAARAESRSIPELLAAHVPTGLVRHVHFNDPNLRGPGQGELDFAPVVRCLAELDYGGWIGVEPFEYVPDGPACAARAIGAVRALEHAVDGPRSAP